MVEPVVSRLTVSANEQRQFVGMPFELHLDITVRRENEVEPFAVRFRQPQFGLVGGGAIVSRDEMPAAVVMVDGRHFPFGAWKELLDDRAATGRHLVGDDGWRGAICLAERRSFPSSGQPLDLLQFRAETEARLR